MPNNFHRLNSFRNEDVYGLAKQELEVDSDINEDANREWLLDQSVSDFLNEMNHQNKMTEVTDVSSQQQASK